MRPRPTLFLVLFSAVSVGFAAASPAPLDRPAVVARAPGHQAPAQKAPTLQVAADWACPLPAPPAALPAYDEAHAYVPLQSGELVAVSRERGAIVWTVKVESPGHLAAGDGLVFVPTLGAIEARDAASGALRWRVEVEGLLSAPPVWQNGWLLIATDRANALMLRAATGERLWQRSFEANLRLPSALTGDRIYAALDNGRVVALQLATGETIWERPLGGRATAIAPLDDRVFVGSDDRHFYCLGWKNGKVTWRWRTGGAIVGTPAIDEDRVYFLALDNVLRALDRGNGHQAWHINVPFRPAAGPVLRNGLLVVSGLAELRGYQAADGREAGDLEVPDLAAPPHPVVTEADAPAAAWLLVTREAGVQLMIPAAPPLASKPFPGKPPYPLW